MPMINLLPWREELRQKRKKEFLFLALGAVLLGGAITFGTKFYYGSLISNQEARNGLLRTEITELNKQNQEIDGLKIQKQRMLERTRVIEQLEQSRPASVTLIDSLVDVIPEGAHLTLVNQQGKRVEIEGVTAATGRISSLIRNINGSMWLRDPAFGGVQYPAGSEPLLEGDFKITATQVGFADDEEAD